MPRPFAVLTAWLALLAATASRGLADPPGEDRVAGHYQFNPYFPHRDSPRLTTPQWVGEPGVEAVVVLAIDDMRDPAVYEKYLRPILNRLKAIDGRAPVSIMTCRVEPEGPEAPAMAQGGPVNRGPHADASLSVPAKGRLRRGRADLPRVR